MDEQENLLEEWLTGTLNSSLYGLLMNREKYGGEKKAPPDDSFGWGALLKQHVEERGSWGLHGFNISGVRGAGKHHAAGFAVNALIGFEYEPRFVNCGELPFSTRGELGAALEQLSVPFAALSSEEELPPARVCIVLDEPNKCPHERELLGAAEDLLCTRLVDKGLPDVFFIIISEEETALPSTLREHMLACKIALPDLDERRRFVLNKAHSSPRFGYYERLAELSEGLTRAELRDVCRNLYRYAIENDCEPDEVMMGKVIGMEHFEVEAVHSEPPEEVPEPPTEPLADKILLRVDRLIDLLPEIVGTIAEARSRQWGVSGAAEVSSSSGESVHTFSKESMGGVMLAQPPEPITVSREGARPKSLEEIAEEIKNMPTGELINSQLTKEELEQIGLGSLAGV